MPYNMGEETPKHKGSLHYYVLCKKAEIPERKYKSHSSENYFGCSYYQEPTKEGLGGSLGNMNYAVKQFQKSENKRKRDLKYLSKQIYIYIAWLSAPAHVAR